MSEHVPKNPPKNLRANQVPRERLPRFNHQWIEIEPNDPAAGGAFIREARKRAVISQSELARRTGLTQQAISRWERGTGDPGLATILKILGACEWELLASLVPRPREAALTRHRPDTRPGTLVITPADERDPDDRRIAQLRQLKEQQRAWRRERQR